MPASNKFGTFGGVFTPSILTILGVIMYMRLPSIVGEAGLLPALGIVLVAHIISFTTGLSVSSIATDKRVQAGGTYYMISRSLGLPIGGTLGLALFVGLSFSVSLYLIGFAESFLGYWGLEITKNSIRLAGTLILLVVTTITLISTSLAIRAQYFIMAAIGLSLLSVLAGSHPYAPSQPLLQNPSSTVPLMVLFGIFFPAVTGFEAGVSMSGDLRDPKKSIPAGSISAIAIGFAVYVGLVVFFSYSVDSKLLAGDPAVLLKISLVPQLVIAGVWGATLSSALGSILGAPRILQATAVDGIAPRIFARGSGATHEPRNALVLTFVIAEGGILIGELDVIARIVSIFFIMTYGFLNLSAAFEIWTSADFRPAFRIPGWVSLIGAVACILVMIQLDFLALIGATLILGLVFAFFKRRELTLATGDAWSGVWASLVKTGIERLRSEQIQQRNWRPNIIMFSGSEGQRHNLVEFGKAISGRLGMISGFELVGGAQPGRRGRLTQVSVEGDGARGIFYYRYPCRDIFEGMEEVSRLFGFSGVEPNTILMGWSSTAGHRQSFGRLITGFDRNGFNTVLLSDQPGRASGSGRKKIDVWWSGSGRNLTFAIALLRHLTTEGIWRAAAMRLLVITYDSTRRERIYRTIAGILDEQRIQMDIAVVNNQDNRLDEYEIIRRESSSADLTVIGLDNREVQSIDGAIASLDGILTGLGRAIVIRGSAGFERVDAGVVGADQQPSDAASSEDESLPLPELPVPADPLLAADISKIDAAGSRVLILFYEKAIAPCFFGSISQVGEFRKIAVSVCASLEKAMALKDEYRRRRAFLKIKNDYVFRSRRLAEQVRQELTGIQHGALAEGISWYAGRLTSDVARFPRLQRIQYPASEFATSRDDSALLRVFKLWKRAKHALLGKPITHVIPYRRAAQHYLHDSRHVFLAAYLKELEQSHVGHLSSLKALIFALLSSIEALEANRSSDMEEVRGIGLNITAETERNETELRRRAAIYRHRLLLEYRKNLLTFATDLMHVAGLKKLTAGKMAKKPFRALVRGNLQFPDRWLATVRPAAEKVNLDILLAATRSRVEHRVEDFVQRVVQHVDSHVTSPLRRLAATVDSLSREEHGGIGFELQCDINIAVSAEDGLEELRDQISELTRSLPERLGVIEGAEELEIPVQRLTDHFVESRMLSPLEKFLASGSESLRLLGYRVKDMVNLARFSLQNIDPEVTDSRTAAAEILGETLEVVRREENAVQDWKRECREETLKLLANAFEPLSPERVAKSAGELSEFLREYAGQQMVTTFQVWRDTAVRFVERRIIRLLYSKSEGLLLARKLKGGEAGRSVNAAVLDLVEAVSPDRNVLERLPQFYINLFSGRSSIGTEFWIERLEDENRMRQAVTRYADGYRGGILVLGERNSGKTAFCKHMADKLFPKERVFHVFPPKEGSTLEEDLRKAFAKATGLEGSLEEIVSALPHSSVTVLHDLELWFERSADGFQAIEAIARLMDEFSEKILFVINTNAHAFSLIHAVEPMQQRFINVIELSRFSTEELKELIIRRHQSSGLRFRWNRREERSLSELKKAGLFDSYFAYSEGNPGVALNAWLDNIVRVSGKTVEIRRPVIPRLSALRRIDDDWAVLLAHFVLHKRLTTERLARITGLETPVVAQMVRLMCASGLIEVRGRDVLSLNMYVEPFIIKVLGEKKLL